MRINTLMRQLRKSPEFVDNTAGTSIQITAKPAKGYLFNGWVGSGPGSYTGTNYNATIILNENITKTASFQSPATSSKSVGSSSVSAQSHSGK